MQLIVQILQIVQLGLVIKFLMIIYVNITRLIIHLDHNLGLQGMFYLHKVLDLLIK